MQAPNKYTTVIGLLASGLPCHDEPTRRTAVRDGMRAFIELGQPIVHELEALFSRHGLEDTRQV